MNRLIVLSLLLLTVFAGPDHRAAAQSRVDFDGNGKADVQLYNPATGDSYTGLGVGDGTFAITPSTWSPGFDVIRLGDFNGDGKTDVLLYYRNGSATYVGIRNDTGFAFSGVFFSPNYMIEVGDFDGNGKTDLLLYNPATGTAWFAVNWSGSNWGYYYALWSPGYTRLCVGDYDGDGHADVLLYRQTDGLAHYARVISFPTGSTNADTTVVPVVLSAHYDIVKAGKIKTGANTGLVLYNRSDGATFSLQLNPDGTYAASPVTGVSAGYNQMQLADVNNDGFADLFLYSDATGAAKIGIANGSGTFSWESPLTWLPQSNFVQAGDLNNDGRADFVLYDSLNNTYSGQQVSEIRNASGTFTASPTAYWGTGRVLGEISAGSTYVTVAGVDPPTSSGASNTPYQFTVHYVSPNGASDIAKGEIIFNTDTSNPNGPSSTGACQIEWFSNGQLNLVNSTPGGVFGSGAPLSNTYCSVDPVGSSLIPTSTGYDVKVRVTFLPAFSASIAAHQIYAYGKNVEGLSSPWTNIGSWALSFTVGTNPAGLAVTVDGAACAAAPCSYQWAAGSTHTIAVSSPQAGPVGSRYSFLNWSDSGAQTHTITAAAATPAYTASFKVQYSLITAVSPAGAGTITPVSGLFYDAGSTAVLSATPNSGYTFSGFSGALSGAASPQNLMLNAPAAVTANFTARQQTITINTAPAGRSVMVDGTQPCTAPCSYQWAAFSTHTIAVTPTTQASVTGTQYVFGNWSDGGGATHTITIPAAATSYTANFTTQYYLTAAATPSAGGTISPASGWYNGGSVVSISASPNSGYTFSGFSGVLSGTTTPQNLTLNAPASVTASFGGGTMSFTVTTLPAGLTIIVDNQSLPAPQTFQWTPGSNHTIAVATMPQTGGTGKQYVFANWSDTGGQSHTITAPSSSTTYTASFTTQYQLTTSASPSAGGTVTPASGWYNAGATVGLAAISSNAYYFNNFSGSASGPAPSSLLMTGPKTVTGNFTALVPITLATVPAGLSVAMDGQVCAAAPCTYQLIAGSNHVIAVNSPTQPGSSGTQYLFANWNVGAAFSHTITIPTSSATFTANFTTQYYLSVTSNPVAGGSTTPASGWFNSGGVTVQATPATGYTFAGFTGAVSGATPQATLTMTGPSSVTANYNAVPVAITLTTSPGGLAVTADGASCAQAPCVYQWTPGSHHTFGIVNTTQPSPSLTDTQYVFTGWSEDPSITVPTTPKTYTAVFKTQYKLTTIAPDPITQPGRGSITPSMGTYWYDSNSTVSISAGASPGYAFDGFTGALQGPLTPAGLEDDRARDRHREFFPAVLCFQLPLRLRSE